MPKPPRTTTNGSQHWLISTSALIGGKARSRPDGPAAVVRITMRGVQEFQCLWFTGDRESPTRTNGPWLVSSSGQFSTVDHLKQIGTQ